MIDILFNSSNTSNKIFCSFVVFVLTSFCLNCGGGETTDSESTTTITGTILDVHNQPVMDAEVTVNNDQVTFLTDESGDFFIEVTVGDHELLVTKYSTVIYSQEISAFEDVPLAMGDVNSFWDNAIEEGSPITQCEIDNWDKIIQLRAFEFLITACKIAEEDKKCECYASLYSTAVLGARSFSYDPLGPELLERWLNGDGKAKEETTENEYSADKFNSENWTLEKHASEMLEPEYVCYENYSGASGNIIYKSNPDVPKSKHSEESSRGVGDFNITTEGQYQIDCSTSEVNISVIAQGVDTVNFNEGEFFCLGDYLGGECQYELCGHYFYIKIPDAWGIYLRNKDNKCSDGTKYRDYEIRSEEVTKSDTKNLSQYSCFTADCSNSDDNSNDNSDDNNGSGDNTPSFELPTSLTLSCDFCEGAFQDWPAIIATLDMPVPREGLSLISTCTAVTGSSFPGPIPDSSVVINFHHDDTVVCIPFAIPDTCEIPGTCSTTYTITDSHSAPWEPFESWAQQFIGQSVTCSF